MAEEIVEINNTDKVRLHLSYIPGEIGVGVGEWGRSLIWKRVNAMNS